MPVLMLDKTRAKKCPRCGTKDDLKVEEVEGYIRVLCDGDNCQEAYWDTLEDALNEWNVRDGVYDTREVA